MIKNLFYILFLSISFSQFTFAQHNKIVTSIEFVGNKHLDSDLLLENMITTQTNGLQRSILSYEATYFDEIVFNQDKNNIIKTYQRNGHLNAKIVDVTFTESDEKVEIKISIEEGDPIKISSVKFFIKDTTHYSDSLSFLLEKLSLTKDEIFRDNSLDSDENEIHKYFYNNGYPHVLISYDVDVIEKEKLAEIKWIIDTGSLCYFGSISISGYERTSENRIRDKITFEKGEIFSGQKIEKSQQNLFNLGIFYLANFKTMVGSDRTKNIVPIEVVIKEAPLFKVGLGVGYGRDEKFRATINTRIVGPWGDPSRIIVEAKHSDLEPLKLSLVYSHSDFLNTESIFRIKTSLRRQTEPGFEAERTGIETAVMRSLSNWLFGSILFNLESVNMDKNQLAQENIGDGFVSSYIKSSASLGFNINTSEPFNNPVKGFTTSLLYTYSGLHPNSKYFFSNYLFDFRTYHKLSNSLIFAYKLFVGAAKAHTTNNYIPVEEKYFSGGSNSVRGWGRSMLGPIGSNGKPIGGKSLWENSTELRIKATDNIGFVLFLDFGNAWLNSYDYNPSEFKYSSGVGFRYSTPIGPIRLDLATPIFEGEKNPLQFWFSIGQAF